MKYLRALIWANINALRPCYFGWQITTCRDRYGRQAIVLQVDEGSRVRYRAFFGAHDVVSLTVRWGIDIARARRLHT